MSSKAIVKLIKSDESSITIYYEDDYYKDTRQFYLNGTYTLTSNQEELPLIRKWELSEDQKHLLWFDDKDPNDENWAILFTAQPDRNEKTVNFILSWMAELSILGVN